MGLGPLLATRVEGLIAAVTIFSVIVGAVVLVPFMLVGAWGRRRSVDFGPFFGYAILLFGFSALVSAVHVPGGTFIHSAIALAPHAYVLALEGVLTAVGWIARRRRSWQPTTAGRVFAAAAVGFAVVAGILGSASVHLTWASRRQSFEEVASALARIAAPGDRVMSIDVSGTKYWSGHGGVVLVNDPLVTIEQVARAYDIRWLALDRADAVTSVAPILDRDERPTWIGKAVLTLDGPDGLRRLGLYPVCLGPSDTRCGR